MRLECEELRGFIFILEAIESHRKIGEERRGTIRFKINHYASKMDNGLERSQHRSGQRRMEATVEISGKMTVTTKVIVVEMERSKQIQEIFKK